MSTKSLLLALLASQLIALPAFAQSAPPIVIRSTQHVGTPIWAEERTGAPTADGTVNLQSPTNGVQASTATRELLRMEAVQRGLPPGLSQAQRDSSLKEAVSARLEFDARREEKVRGRGRKPGAPNPDGS